MKRLLIAVLLLPFLLGFLGAASNQLVIVSNHGCFPVLLNPAWVAHTAPDLTTGMLSEDPVHCEMTPFTHLNFLADVFNFGGAIESIGDLLLDAGSALAPYCFGFCFALLWFTPSIKVTGGSSTPKAFSSDKDVQGTASALTIQRSKGLPMSGLFLADSTKSDPRTITRS